MARVSELATEALQSLIDAQRTAVKTLITPVYNVKGYGAAGDGATDDTTAIQSAITQANTDGGGIIFFPEGTYRVTSLQLYSKLMLVGCGHGITILKKVNSFNGTGTTAPIIRGYTEDSALSHITICDMTLDGNRASQSGGTGDGNAMGIRVGGWNDFTLRDVYIQDCWTDGLYFCGYGTSNLTEGIGYQVTNVVITNSRRNNCSIVTGYDFQFVNCTFDNANGTAPQDGVDIEPDHANADIRNIQFTNCRFTNNVGCGLRYYDKYASRAALKLVVDPSCLFVSNTEWGCRIYSPDYQIDRPRIGGTYHGNTEGGIYIQRCQRAVIDNYAIWGSATNMVGIKVTGYCVDCVIGTGTVNVGGTSAVDVQIVTNALAGGLPEDTFISDDCRMVGATTGLSDTGTRTRVGGRFHADHTVDVASIAAGASATFNVTVTGASGSYVVCATPVTALEDGLSYIAYVSATDTVTVKLTNFTAAPIDPANRTWRIACMKK